MKTNLILGAVALAAPLLFCGCPLSFTPEETVVQTPSESLIEPSEARGLTLARCAGSPSLQDLSGVYAAAFESAADVAGLPTTQTEVVTRYGVLQLCQDGQEVEAMWMLCALDISPVVDDSGTCAAQRPSSALVNVLPAVEFGGSVTDLGPYSEVELHGLTENWGIEATAELPAEPEGIETVEASGLVDQDDDGAPGVTLKGDGAVPTISWAVRRTAVSFQLTLSDDNLSGTTSAETEEVILGGPAVRVLRGRARTSAQGTALLVRADSTQAVLDADGDGVVTCEELQAFYSVLPAPRALLCER